MELHNLPKLKSKRKRRLGQGHGSGRVKTSGRGTKGQKARNKVPIYFEGGALPLIKRMPFLRGKGKNKSFRKGPLIINVKLLNIFEKNATINLDSLVKKGLIREKDKNLGVKILGDGELNVSLNVSLPVSKGARSKIEKAMGKVVLNSKE